jgi:hypothetical protein
MHDTVTIRLHLYISRIIQRNVHHIGPVYQAYSKKQGPLENNDSFVMSFRGFRRQKVPSLHLRVRDAISTAAQPQSSPWLCP